MIHVKEALNFLQKKAHSGWNLFTNDDDENQKDPKFPEISGNFTRFPVIIIPGLGGSIVYNKWDFTKDAVTEPVIGFPNPLISECKKTSSEWSPIWVNPIGALPSKSGSDCWRYRMTPNYTTDRGFHDKPGVLTSSYKGIEPIDSRGNLVLSDSFGGIEGVDILMQINGTSIPISMAYMFHYLIGDLKKKGYREKIDMFGAPYDFRLISTTNHRRRYFAALKLLIEHAVSTTGKKVVLLTHSLGCSVTQNFLSDYIPSLSFFGDNQSWKDKHIKLWIPVGTPFGGAPKTFRTVVSGDDEGMGMLCSLVKKNCNPWYSKLEQKLSGVCWMLPDKTLYAGYPMFNYPNNPGLSPLVQKDFEKIMTMVGSVDTARAFEREIVPLNKNLSKPPMVPLCVIAGVTNPTEMQFFYDDLGKNPRQIVKDGKPFYAKSPEHPNDLQTEILSNEEKNLPDYPFCGDNTVPWIATHFSKIWLNGTIEDESHKYYGIRGSRANGKHQTEIKEFIGPAYDHKDMLNLKDVRDFIIGKLVSQETPRFLQETPQETPQEPLQEPPQETPQEPQQEPPQETQQEPPQETRSAEVSQEIPRVSQEIPRVSQETPQDTPEESSRFSQENPLTIIAILLIIVIVIIIIVIIL